MLVSTRLMLTLLSLGFVALGSALIAPAAASAQRPDTAPRLGAHFAAAFLGDVNTSGRGLETSASLDPTLGGALRVELPVHEYVVIGGFFEVLAFEADVVGAEREPVFNFDAMLKGRYLFAPTPDLGIEGYAAVVVGPTLGLFDDPDGSGDEIWPGWNIGLLGGAAVLFEAFGLFLEIGWRFHQTFTEFRLVGVDVDVQRHTHQLALQAGAFFRL